MREFLKKVKWLPVVVGVLVSVGIVVVIANGAAAGTVGGVIVLGAIALALLIE